MSVDSDGFGGGLSTRVLGWEHLAAAIDSLAPLAPEGLLLEAPLPQAKVGPIAARVAHAGVPLIGAIAPFAPEEEGAPTLDRPERDHEVRAAHTSVLELLSRCGGDRLILRCGRGGVEGAGLMAETLDAEREGAGERLRSWREARRSSRERAVLQLLRRLHVLRGAHPGVRWLLLPGADPTSLLDPETLDWILEDQGEGLSLALDLGALGLRAARGDEVPEKWFDRFGARVGLVLISDHDGRGNCALLPGMGTLDWPQFRGIFPHHCPWVLRPDPRIPLEFLGECRRLLSQWVGRSPEVTG